MAHYLLGDGKRGQMSRAAERLNCQPSYLSRVVNTDIHLTPDQAFLLTRFWHLGRSEEVFFRTLVDAERASDSEYRAELIRQIAELRSAQESLQKRTEKQSFPVAEMEALYFSSWHFSALHFLVCIPAFQTVRALATRLCINEVMVLSHLKILESLGLVREDNHRWLYSGGQFHIAKDSPFVVFHHQNWRGRALLDAQNFASEGLHYTTVLTLSQVDAGRLKQRLLEFISDSERIARPSEPEDSVVLTCDLFRT